MQVEQYSAGVGDLADAFLRVPYAQYESNVRGPNVVTIPFVVRIPHQLINIIPMEI